jgi:hypothetical protein
MRYVSQRVGIDRRQGRCLMRGEMRFRRSGSPKRTSRTTIPTLAVLISLACVLLVAAPATAGSAWDPNDAGYRLDIRWVGVYQESDGQLRITVVFYDPVRLKWFRTGSGSPFESRSAVAFTDDRDIPPYLFVAFFVNNRHRLRAALCEGGSGCNGVVKVHRPNRWTIRARVTPFGGFGPAVGWSFRGMSWLKGFAHPTDRTRWGVVT